MLKSTNFFVRTASVWLVITGQYATVSRESVEFTEHDCLTSEQMSSHQPQISGNKPISMTTRRETCSVQRREHNSVCRIFPSYPNLRSNLSSLIYLDNNVADAQEASGPLKLHQWRQCLTKAQLRTNNNVTMRRNIHSGFPTPGWSILDAFNTTSRRRIQTHWPEVKTTTSPSGWDDLKQLHKHKKAETYCWCFHQVKGHLWIHGRLWALQPGGCTPVWWWWGRRSAKLWSATTCNDLITATLSSANDPPEHHFVPSCTALYLHSLQSPVQPLRNGQCDMGKMLRE